MLTIIKATSVVAATATAAYTMAAAIAVSDGADVGFEIPHEITALTLTVVTVTALVASIGWLLAQSSEVLLGELRRQIALAATTNDDCLREAVAHAYRSALVDKAETPARTNAGNNVALYPRRLRG